MNRLVIIGNGFDLAHGLPTGYCDFINDYWLNVLTNMKFPFLPHKQVSSEDEILKIKLHFDVDYYDMEGIRYEFSLVKTFKELEELINKYKCSISFKNKFFKIINEKQTIQNWVDIENEYYKLLKECLKYEDNIKVTSLNEEFEQVKNLLEHYLEDQICKKYNFKITQANEILKIFLKTEMEDAELDQFYHELQKEDVLEIMKFMDEGRKENFNMYSIDTLHFLTFNYTPLVGEYLNVINSITKYKCNEIHGRVHDLENPVNFGFGDERDKQYPEIEEKNDNEFLRNIKSFAYLNNSNYKDLLDFIDSNKFQVYIMGHSCGLSDRTLLNTVFEHHNCRSIKIYYHQYKKDGRIVDNYTDIVQNISRQFDRKDLLRRKVVNKKFCQPLPQNIRFEIKQKQPTVV